MIKRYQTERTLDKFDKKKKFMSFFLVDSYKSSHIPLTLYIKKKKIVNNLTKQNFVQVAKKKKLIKLFYFYFVNKKVNCRPFTRTDGH